MRDKDELAMEFKVRAGSWLLSHSVQYTRELSYTPDDDIVSGIAQPTKATSDTAAVDHAITSEADRDAKNLDEILGQLARCAAQPWFTQLRSRHAAKSTREIVEHATLLIFQFARLVNVVIAVAKDGLDIAPEAKAKTWGWHDYPDKYFMPARDQIKKARTKELEQVGDPYLALGLRMYKQREDNSLQMPPVSITTWERYYYMADGYLYLGQVLSLVLALLTWHVQPVAAVILFLMHLRDGCRKIYDIKVCKAREDRGAIREEAFVGLARNLERIVKRYWESAWPNPDESQMTGLARAPVDWDRVQTRLQETLKEFETLQVVLHDWNVRP